MEFGAAAAINLGVASGKASMMAGFYFQKAGADFALTGYFLYDLWSRVESTGPLETAHGLIRIDAFGLFFSAILLVVAALSVLVSISFLGREEADRPSSTR